jgi:6-phosphogluconolactonase
MARDQMIAGELVVANDAKDLAARATDFIAKEITASTTFRFVLSGGSTPRSLYTLLGERHDLPWKRVELFLGDERFVPHDHPDSNLRMVHETLLVHGIRPGAIHPIATEGAADDAAARYDALLRSIKGRPMFDLNLLGLGEDGHTASLLPGQPVLEERNKLVAAVPKGRSEERITLTYPALESSRITMFLVSGAAKADMVKRARAGDMSIPAGRLRPQGSVIWFVDRAAAGA